LSKIHFSILYTVSDLKMHINVTINKVRNYALLIISNCKRESDDRF